MPFNRLFPLRYLYPHSSRPCLLANYCSLSFFSSHITCPRKPLQTWLPLGPHECPGWLDVPWIRRMLPEDSGFPSILALITLPCDCLFASVQLLSHVWLFATPWTAVRQASLSITNSLSLLKLMSIEWVMPSNQLILCLQSFPASGSYPMIKFFTSGGQSIGQSLFACYPTKPIHTLGHILCCVSVHTLPSQMYFFCPPACPLPWRLTSKDGFHRFPCPLASGWFGSTGRGPSRTGGWRVRSWRLCLTPSLGDRLRLATSLTEVPSCSSSSSNYLGWRVSLFYLIFNWVQNDFLWNTIKMNYSIFKR